MNTATERDMKDRSHSRLGRDALETLASPMSFLFFNYGSIGLFTLEKELHSHSRP